MPPPSFPPCAAFPPCARPSLPPAASAFLAAFSRGAARRYAGPSRRVGAARGWPPPLRPRPRRWRGVARPAPGAGHSSPRRHPDTLRGRDPRLGSGWNSLVPTLFEVGTSLASASGVALGGHAGLCPAGKAARVKIGGVLRGVLPRSSALRASGGGARVLKLQSLPSFWPFLAFKLTVPRFKRYSPIRR